MFSIKQNYSQFRRNLNSKQYYSNQKRSQNSQSYRNKNHTYQNRSQMSRNDRFFRVKIIIKMKNSRKSSSEQDFFKSKNNEKYDKKNERLFENDKQKRDKNDRQEKYDKKNKYDDRFKVKIYLIHDDNQNTDNEIITDDCENYHQSQNLQYFDFDYDFEKLSDFEITVLTTTTTEFSCRRCDRIFFFNNQLHKHIRVMKCIKTQSTSKTKKSETYLNIFAINDDFISLISFKVDLNKDIEIEYKFKNWKYVTINVNLSLNSKSDFSCIDFEANITFIDEEFFQKKIKVISIKIMITSIAVKEFDITKHTTNKYVILSMYFADTKNDTFANAVITREVHLIKGLKANLLIENDILSSKMIDISNSTRSIYIDNCDVTISIIIKTNIRSQCRFVHALKAFMISSKSKCLISVHNIVSLSNRDFLFEFWETVNLFIYAHIFDFETSFILIRNDQNRVIKVSRNFRLSTITELDYFSAYQADSENVLKLAIKHFKSTHKISWFNKIVTTFTTFAISNDNNIIINDLIVKQSLNDLILFNEIIIHNFSQEAITSFTNFVNKVSRRFVSQNFDFFVIRIHERRIRTRWH